MGEYLDKVLALAVQVKDYQRQTATGVVRVNGYSRMGNAAMRQHLVNEHGMSPHSFGDDFNHPVNLASWHGMDHLGRSHGHAHDEEDSITHGGGHAGSHVGGSGHHVPQFQHKVGEFIGRRIHHAARGAVTPGGNAPGPGVGAVGGGGFGGGLISGLGGSTSSASGGAAGGGAAGGGAAGGAAGGGSDSQQDQQKQQKGAK